MNRLKNREINNLANYYLYSFWVRSEYEGPDKWYVAEAILLRLLEIGTPGEDRLLKFRLANINRMLL